MLLWLTAVKATLPSLNIECYGWKVRENYNGTRRWFSENQLPLLIVISSKTDFKKRATQKQKQKSPQKCYQ